jgi:hypothetical protein
LDYYLRLWDGLSRAGVIVAGSGSSDAHSARVGWQTGNNYATYICADGAGKPHGGDVEADGVRRTRAGIDQDALLAGLRARNIYPADPVRFRSRLALTDDVGHQMGEVVRVHGAEERTASITLESARPQWYLAWVVNGERQRPVRLGEGFVSETRRFAVPGDKPAWIRAEVWDPTYAADGTQLERPASDPLEGRCLALTNPIWYVPQD